MKLVVLTVGKPKDKRIAALAEDYLRRVRPSGTVGTEIVPDVAASRREDVLEREGQELLKRFRPRDRVILLREDGREFDSPAFASFLTGEMSSAEGRVMLVIGGPWGVSDAVKRRSDEGVALSRMTLTHELCFLFLAEQIYRAFSILQGTGYHH